MLVILSFDGLYYGDLSKENTPALNALASEGLYVKKLKSVFPSVTAAVHASFLTGVSPAKSGVFGNVGYNRQTKETIDYFSLKAGTRNQLLKQDTIIDYFARKEMRVATICWPLTYGDKNIRYNIPEFYAQGDFDAGITSAFCSELNACNFPIAQYGKWSQGHLLNNMQDKLTCDIVKHLIAKEDGPDVIMGHFLYHDSLQHDYGVNSAEAIYAMHYVDQLIAQIVHMLSEDSHLIVFSDHGHHAVNHTISPLALFDDVDISGYEVVYDAGSIYLYSKRHHASDDCHLAKQIEKKFGVREVYTRKKLRAIGLQSTVRSNAPDIVISLSAGVQCLDGANFNRATHGYHPEYCDRMNGLFIYTGPRYQSEVREEMKMEEVKAFVESLYQ